MSRRPVTTRRRDPARLYGVMGLGVAAVLAVLVFLSWNATNGLPGASSYTVVADVPDANRMIVNNQVRIAGVRVGRVSAVDASPPEGAGSRARPYARLRLELDPEVGPLPRDTAVKIRPASILGATYVDLVPGRDGRTIASGGTIGLAQASGTVELTDLFDVFDRQTSRNIQSSITQIGGGLSGRGADLGETISNLEALAPKLRSVSENLAAPATRLADLVPAYQRTIGALDARRGDLGTLIDGGAGTFAALRDAKEDLGRTLDAYPSSARVATRALEHLRPAVDRLAALSTALQPATRRLPVALDRLNPTLVDGLAPFRLMPRFGRDLRTTLASLDRLSRQPETDGTVRKLDDAFAAAGETLEVLTPAQVECDFLGGSLYNFFGFIGKLGLKGGPSIANMHITQLADSPLEFLQNKDPLPNLHRNYLPNMNAQECEAGNEPYAPDRQSLTNPPGLQGKQRPRVPPVPATTRELAREAGLLSPPPEAGR